MLSAYLDDVRVYNYALTADDVLAVKNGGEPDSIDTPTANDDSQPVVYGLDGIRRTTLQRGLNIVDGKKVLK